MSVRDYKAVYFIAGIVSSFAIYVEKKTRREELGLYVLPRTIESLYLLLPTRLRRILTVPHAEMLIFASSMSVLVYFIKTNPSFVSPLIRAITGWVLNKKSSKKIDDERRAAATVQ